MWRSAVAGFLFAALAASVQYALREGLIASVPEFASAAPTFSAVRRAVRVLERLGARFEGPPPAAVELRPSDVWVITPPKSGTTWVTHMAHQLRTGGREVDFADQDDVVPWVEMLDTDFLDGTALNRNPNGEHVAFPRVFKSHLSFAALPPGPYRKVFVFRDPADMLVSAAEFLPTLWGIVNPPSVPALVSFFLWNGDLRTMLQSLVSVWQVRNREDVLVIFYEEALRDRAAVVERLGRFMGVAPNASLVARVTEQTSHAAMSREHRAFANIAQARNMHRAQNLPFNASSLVGKVRRNGGRAGDGSRLSPAFVDAVRRAWDTHARPALGFESFSALQTAYTAERLAAKGGQS